MPAAVSAVTDIQRALNVIRSIERDAAVETRLAALALITGTAADIARELHGVDQRPQKRAAAKPTAKPNPSPLCQSHCPYPSRLHPPSLCRLQSHYSISASPSHLQSQNCRAPAIETV